jgi:Arc/MetJ-type ribon-helix-helix transcriptional regulator
LPWTIRLDPETTQLIQQEVHSGHFRDAASLIHAAIRYLLVTREDLGHTREEIDAMLAGAVESLERGEGVDGEEFFLELKQEEAELRRRA